MKCVCCNAVIDPETGGAEYVEVLNNVRFLQHAPTYKIRVSYFCTPGCMDYYMKRRGHVDFLVNARVETIRSPE